MKNALSKLLNDRKSIEQLQAEAEEYEELLMEAKQNDAGITIRNISNIIDEFEDVLIKKYDDIVEALRFREDLEISELEFCSDNYSGMLFSVVSKVNDKRLYFPTAEDGITQADIDNYVDEMVNYISNNIESMKDYVESIRYRVIKDGGNMPVASGIYCDECDEEYICIDDGLAEVGTCLNCGAHNDIAECERCGQYYHDYDGDEIKLCDSCKDYYKNE